MATKSTAKKSTGTKTTGTKTTGTKATRTSAKSTTKTATKKNTRKPKKISEDVIRKKAQEIYDKRILNGVPGNAESDWLQAEKELFN